MDARKRALVAVFCIAKQRAICDKYLSPTWRLRHASPAGELSPANSWDNISALKYLTRVSLSAV